MSIAKTSTLHNSYRYFTIAIQGYEDRCLRGAVYHGREHRGVWFKGLVEMILYMNQEFDEMSCPKQTMELRKFSGTHYPTFEADAQMMDSSVEEQAMAVFSVYVKYRYNASWQGRIVWKAGNQGKEFDSLLEMIQWMKEILAGKQDTEGETDTVDVCQVSLDSYENRIMRGHIQNVRKEYLEDFISTADMSDQMFQIFEVGIPGVSEKIVSEKSWNAFRKGGEKATFVVKILFREHSTWQGTIFWRERQEHQVFRSFLEMLILMASALDSLESPEIPQYTLNTFDSIDIRTANGERRC